MVSQQRRRLIKLPPHSPDLNPIENLWGDLKRRIEQRFPRNLSELRQFLTEEWESTPQSTCSSLVNSMPDRMRAVIDVEGHKTGY
jgi:transposase